MQRSHDEVGQAFHVYLAGSDHRVDEKSCCQDERNEINRRDAADHVCDVQDVVIDVYIVIIYNLVLGVDRELHCRHPVLRGKEEADHAHAKEFAKDPGGLDDGLYVDKNHHE